jgi:hypothetical protein
MAEKENSAFRLYKFIQRMVPQPETMPTSQALLRYIAVVTRLCILDLRSTSVAGCNTY